MRDISWVLSLEPLRRPNQTAPRLPVRAKPGPRASAGNHCATSLGLVLAVFLYACSGTVAATSPGSANSMVSAREDASESEFERLMAVARKTRQGSGSSMRRLAIEGRPALGTEDAPVILVEMASFECPHCRHHWLDTMPELRRRYIESGQMRYVFVDVVIDPRHQNALAAATAAHCANEQGRYVAFRDQIYTNQKAISPVFLETHAQAAGLDLADFRQCLANGRYQTRVEDDTALARELRVRGTPSFFWARTEPGRSDVRLLSRVNGARPIEEFAKQFDALNQYNRAANATLIESLN